MILGVIVWLKISIKGTAICLVTEQNHAIPPPWMGQESAVSIATRYELNCPGIKSWWR
jgi:hypothetical protein